MSGARTHALFAVGVMCALPLLVLTGCGGSTSPNAGPPVAGGVPTITSANPDSGTRNFTLDVRVLGSGYDRDSRAIWALNSDTAFARTKIRTNSTRYVSSNEVVANITISSDALEAMYDVVVVTSSGQKGIGSERFAVKNTRYALTLQGGLQTGSIIFSGVAKTADPFNGIGGNNVFLTIPAQALGSTAICAAYPTEFGPTTSSWGEYVGEWAGDFTIDKQGAQGIVHLSFFGRRANGSPGFLNLDIHAAYTETNTNGIITLTAATSRGLVGATSTPRGTGFDAVDRCISFSVVGTP